MLKGAIGNIDFPSQLHLPILPYDGLVDKDVGGADQEAGESKNDKGRKCSVIRHAI